MEQNLVVEKFIAVYEGEFKPGFVKRRDARNCDGFVYFLAGSADYIFENKRIAAIEGDTLYLPEGSMYNIIINEETRYICIDFAFTTKGNQPTLVRTLRGIQPLFYKFFYNFSGNSAYRIPKGYEIINRIYCEILRADNKDYSKSDELYSKACEIILQKYRNEDFTVEALATELGFSTVHLRRIFASCSALSPIKYINGIRFEQAKHLLLSSNLSVGEIALSVGFPDQFHFSKAFKQAIGIPPSRYRETKGASRFN